MFVKGLVNYNVMIEFEKRVERMKEKLIKGDDDLFKFIVRELWMIEFFLEMKDFGFGLRIFKRRVDDIFGD